MTNPFKVLSPVFVALALAGCATLAPQPPATTTAAAPEPEQQATSTPYKGPKASAPVPADVRKRMDELGMSKTSPILIRIFKQERQLEVWKVGKEGRYALLKSYPICTYSGELGPKKRQGDKQAPEGFYSVYPNQMNPNSNYYLSFDVGFPNAYDRSLGRDGANLMVHGNCLSAGCYAMGDDGIREIYALARDALAGGQPFFQVQAMPFRMTDANMFKNASNPNIAFWRMLKVGSDFFEQTGQEPSVSVKNRAYAFNAPQPKPEPTMLAGLENKDVSTVVALVPPRRF